VIDLTVAFPIAVVAISCNLCLLAAMAAGRAETGSWSWALWLFVEIALLGASAGLAGWVTLADGNRDAKSVIGFILVLILGFGLAVVLAFLEYSAAGLRRRFGSDLRGSLWPTRTGINRL
jgi:hypothetical protein